MFVVTVCCISFIFIIVTISVRTSEDAIVRYNKVLKLVKGGCTKADAYIRMRVDRKTIVNQTSIAEMATVNPELFRAMQAIFKKGDSLHKFAVKCMAECIKEPHNSLISALKRASDLLDIEKQNGNSVP